MTEPALLDAGAAIDRFCALLQGDAELQLRLSRLLIPEEFAAAAVDAARSMGIAFGREDVRAKLVFDPLGIRRFGDAPITGRDIPVGDWLPVAIVASGGELALDWVHFAGMTLDTPFFVESLRRARALPINRLIQHRTPLSTLAAALGDAMPVPDGFIFHLSRCGSTLTAQMFAADPRNVVLSEAEPIDAAIQLAQTRTDVSLAERLHLLRAIVGELGRDRKGEGGHFIVKLDSWHSFALPLLRQAFPDTPWVFLYREPVEILVSHDLMAGMQTVRGAMPFDPYGIEDGGRMAPGEYAACALGRTAAAVVEHFDLGGGLLVNYADLPGAVETQIMPHFGIRPDAAAVAAMAVASRRNAKAPTEAFASDTEAKQQAAGAKLRALAAAYMDEPYRHLEALRLAAGK